MTSEYITKRIGSNQSSTTTEPAQITSTPPVVTTLQAGVDAYPGYTVTTTGTPSPIVSAQDLPSWMDFDGTDLTSDDPIPVTEEGDIDVIIEAENGVGQDLQHVTFEVLPAIAPEITSTPPVVTTLQAGVDSYPGYTVTATGTPDPTTSATSGLPTWMDFDGTDLTSDSPILSNADYDSPVDVLLTSSNGKSPDATQHVQFSITHSPAIQLTDWSALNYYQGANGAGPTAPATGFTVGVVYAVAADNVGSDRALCGQRIAAGTTGWFQAAHQTHGYAYAHPLNVSYASTYAANKAYFDVMVVTAENKILLYRNGGTLDAASSPGTYVAPGGTDAVTVGSLKAGVAPATGIAIIGFAVCNSLIMSAGQVGAWYTLVNAAGTIVRAASGTTHLWDAYDAGATWVDRIAGISLTRNGSLTSAAFTPSWG